MAPNCLFVKGPVCKLVSQYKRTKHACCLKILASKFVRSRGCLQADSSYFDYDYRLTFPPKLSSFSVTHPLRNTYTYGGTDSAIRVKGLSGSSGGQYQPAQMACEGEEISHRLDSEFTSFCSPAWLLKSLSPRSQLFAFYISSYTL